MFGCSGTVVRCEEPGQLGSDTASDGFDLGGAVEMAADRTSVKICFIV